MVVAYWIVAGLLVLLYLFAGGSKVVRSKEQLRPMMGWVDTVPLWFVRALGAVEVLGAIGLVLPPLTGIATWLALVAAVGLLVVQFGAIALHLKRGEAGVLGLNVVTAVLAAAAVWLSTVWL
ncbi:DoxX family protein [Glycomyces harbinensis]|uniref:DoxX-like family protein n=1 Tax=Glycomyces harbinensis TaxID=58114 RepID=A0A1G7DKS2_9ACTN|nr:DoxX family protein [Glycomyces harbinensis]SDE52121.1 DoxX-like family protein [Glycomyces harbinensis]